MGVLWLLIEGRPTRAIGKTVDELADLVDARVSRSGILLSVEPIRNSVDGEAASCVVQMQNAEGQAARLFAVPPISARATVYRDAEAVFSGVVDTIDLSADCRVTVTA